MNILLAAVDDSAACRPILEVGSWAAGVIGAQLVGVHVQLDGSGATARATAETLGVPLLVRNGDVVSEIGAAREELHAVGLVVGARAFPGSATPAGHVTLDLAHRTTVPLVVVPPEVRDHHVGRILVALGRNGDAEVVLALAEQLSPAAPDTPGAQPDIVAVHVLGPDALPLFGDDATFESEAWAREFLRRASSNAAARVHLELRVGDPAVQVCEAVRDLDADLVVLAWNRELEAGHARIVRRVLETVRVPLVLLASPGTEASVGALREAAAHERGG